MLKRRPKKHRLSSSYPLSDHYNGSTFFNPDNYFERSFKHLLPILKGLRQTQKWPVFVNNQAQPQLAENLTLDKSHITYINHASHLIQLRNLNILTDPIYSKRAGPFSLIGPKRVRQPGIALKKLPHIHIVLISHNHYDHMDLPTLKHLEKLFNPLFIVPLGNQTYLKRKKIDRIIELDWWETHALNDNQSITLVPAQHWSSRTMRDTNKALWGGFWISSGDIKIYFAGDSGYGQIFKQIQQKLGSPDISILPIGSYEPRWFMKSKHMNPEEAVLASLDLKTNICIASHHLTFRLSYEYIDAPTIAFKQSIHAHKLNPDSFLVPQNGETIIYKK